jgi:hypothetical protein
MCLYWLKNGEAHIPAIAQERVDDRVFDDSGREGVVIITLFPARS